MTGSVTASGDALRIGSAAGSLTISGNLDMTTASLSFDGPGNVIVSGNILQGVALPLGGVSGELEIWLDASDLNGNGIADQPADGALISNWEDKSGKNRDFDSMLGDPNYVATGTHGRPTVNFDGNDALRTNLTNNNPRHFIDGNGEFTLISVARYSGATRGRVIAPVTGHNWLFGFHGSSSNNNGHYDGWGSQNPAPVGASNDTNWHLHANQMNVFSDVTNPAGDWWRDGLLATNDGRGTADAFTNNVPDGLSLGGWNGLSEASTAEVSELIMFNRVLSDAELQIIQRYLSTKYSLGYVAAAAAPTVTKLGLGTVTFSGNNSFAAPITVSAGTLVAAHSNALGTTAQGTTVSLGATLGFSGGITLAGETLTINGLGAAGQPGVLVNVSGNNIITAASAIIVTDVSSGSFGIGSIDDPLTLFVDTFTIDSPIDMRFSKLIGDGTGNTVLNGVLYATSTFVTPNLNNLNTFGDGDYTITAASQTFTAHVDNDGTNSWILVGRGREGWDFDLDGPNSAPNLVKDNLGTVAGFTPRAFSHTIIRDIMAQSGINMSNLEVRLRRAANTTGTAYQESRWRDFTGNGNLWTWDFDDSQYGVTMEMVSSGGEPGTNIAVAGGKNTRDAEIGGNDGDRIFTWPWANHNNQRGFTYGSAVGGVDNNNATSFLWEFTIENHAIPYTEVYIRSRTPVPLVADNQLVKNGSGTLVLTGANTFNAGTTVNAGTLRVNNTTGSGTGPGIVTVNNAGSVLGGDGIIGNNVTLNAGATLDPGATVATTAKLTVNGNVTFNAASRLNVDIIGGVTAGTDYDQLVVTGTGSVTVDNNAFIAGPRPATYQPVNGTTYTIFDVQSAGTLTGSFTSEAAVPTPFTSPTTVVVGGKTYGTSYTANTGNDFVLNAVSAIRVWDGGGTDNNWTTDANWVADAAPFASDDLVFNDIGVSVRPNPTNDYAANFVFNSISLANTANNYALDGNAVVVNSNITNSSGTGTTNSINLSLGGVATVSNTDSGTLLLAGTNTYSGDTTDHRGHAATRRERCHSRRRWQGKCDCRWRCHARPKRQERNHQRTLWSGYD